MSQESKNLKPSDKLVTKKLDSIKHVGVIYTQSAGTLYETREYLWKGSYHNLSNGRLFHEEQVRDLIKELIEARAEIDLLKEKL